MGLRVINWDKRWMLYLSTEVREGKAESPGQEAHTRSWIDRELNLQNIPIRIESALVKNWYRATGLRPSSSPFVSGDAFRVISAHVLEGEKHRSRMC